MNFLQSITSRQWLYIAIAITAIIIIVLLVKSNNRKKEEERRKAAEKNGTDNIMTMNTDSQFPLSYGARGENVKLLQSKLNEKYKAGLTVDGIWGPLTDEAVRKYLNVSVVTSQIYLTA